MEKKIKLFHVVEAFGGGVFNAIQDLCKYAGAGCEITVVHSLRQETPQNYKDYFSEHIRFIHVPMVRSISPFGDLKALLGLIRIFMKEKPDVIHLHSSKAGFLGRIAGSLTCVKRVYYSPHGFAFLRQDVTSAARFLLYLLEKFAVIFGGRLIAVSEDEYRYAKRLSGKSVFIPNSIDLNLPNEIAVSDGTGIIRVGTSGRISPQKAPERFCRIASQLTEKASFVWIGDGELRDTLNNCKADIDITGWKSHREVLELVAGLDIYIQTSKWEGMPISVLEAMSLERPIIATNIVGNRDLVVHGVNGYLADDEESFSHFLTELIKDSNLRKRMGAESKKLVAEKHDIRKAAIKYEGLYSGAET